MKYIHNLENTELTFLNELGLDIHKQFYKTSIELNLIESCFFKREGLVAICPTSNPLDETVFEEVCNFLEVEDVIDYREAEEEEAYVNGFNSIVVNFQSENAFFGLNSLVDETVFEEICEDFELTPNVFSIVDMYQTSDILKITPNYVFVCLDLIIDKKEKKQLLSILKSLKKQIFFISEKHVKSNFTKNVLEINKELFYTKTDIDLKTEIIRGVDIDFSKIIFFE